ncbi:D-alanyl-D-alanine carboxypeptidase/D-alanyl-D-alanine-endopeptidase [Hoyosella sp. YIM 151337]|uniref:D-alanyl-D-alanine carboxypeptidase/D-alanyl-D-alanine endopeptidase n=1 Tax=Hoyosella sp. YIM 151337 TaxID=2992742 RepID=UPI0022369865|nr:D-alanyl-D-alanine carboxypeptidase/D-alanyl-D-alanine-endopeptidase [Hoyosella sp. YIM 151337]MCW4352751.1 D-alanyl-D-alanine carboxypeptidase/D-alanyl-D-alanine-endopeptidase [Hoyosella sp. YIM 151337]
MTVDKAPLPGGEAEPSGPPLDSAPSAAAGARRARPYRRGALIAVFAAIVLIVASTGTLVAARYAESFRQSSATVAEPPPLVEVQPAILPLPDAAPMPTQDEVAAALDPWLSDPALGSLAGRVTDASTGTVLWAQDHTERRIPASAAKVLTGAAALLVLPLDGRVETRVVAGSEPGEVVLVGAGDVTLSAQPEGAPTYYEGAPRIDDLAAQVRDSGTEVRRVVVDTTAFTGARLAPGWSPESVGEGYVAPMEPVMLDGGRIDPLEPESPRWDEPALAAGRTLAERLGADPDSVTAGVASTGAQVLAQVSSAPLRVRLDQFMQQSDNVLAEAIGREIAVAVGEPASFRGAVRAIPAVLAEHGLPADDIVLADASGLSRENVLSVSALDTLLARAAAESAAPEELAADDTAAALRPLLDLLPVAAGTGTLEARFTEAAASGTGWVRAKTGTLDGVNALAGYAVTRTGRVLTFAFISTDSSAFEARPALDALAAQLRTVPRAGE